MTDPYQRIWEMFEFIEALGIKLDFVPLEQTDGEYTEYHRDAKLIAISEAKNPERQYRELMQYLAPISEDFLAAP